MTQHVTRYLQRYPAIGALAYGAILVALALFCWLKIADLQDRRASLAATQDVLAQLQRHWPAARGAAAASGAPRGSPFLEGSTVTVAGAGLLQRVSSLVSQVGGRVLSSQVDLQATAAKPGFISVLINCEVDQPGLQKLLYDLEAGMPFLFVDQLEVRTVDQPAAAKSPPMHVLFAASGQWVKQP